MSAINNSIAHSRRVLLLVTGLNPQLVTETLYALIHQKPAFVPTELHLITTKDGASRAQLMLLGEEKSWFKNFCDEYHIDIDNVTFNKNTIHTIKTETGGELDDIRDLNANQSTADAISEFVQKITSDNNSALHASIAGGRKTMGFYLGYSLSLFGREQDRLSHVLVSPQFESHPEFYYTETQSRVIFANDRSRTLWTKHSLLKSL